MEKKASSKDSEPLKVILSTQDKRYMPRRYTTGSAGFDLFAEDNYTVRHGEYVLISTGVQCAIPSGFFGLIVGRSGLACQGLVVHTGVIDSDYR